MIFQMPISANISLFFFFKKEKDRYDELDFAARY